MSELKWLEEIEQAHAVYIETIQQYGREPKEAERGWVHAQSLLIAHIRELREQLRWQCSGYDDCEPSLALLNRQEPPEWRPR